MKSPISGAEMKLVSENDKLLFRKEEYSYVHLAYRCPTSGQQFTDTALDEANLFQVYNQYRVRHGIPFPDEIAALRQHYGLAAAKMSQILGFGINQYRAYEDGEVPSLSNARTLIAARKKGLFLDFLEAAKSDMNANEYIRVKRKIEAVPGDFIPGTRPTVFSGYRALSRPKITEMVQILISHLGVTFVTKMNKLLFYADFIHYKHHGFGITGLTYRALPFGPVPDAWAGLYEALPGVSMEEFVYSSGQSGIQLEIQTVPNPSVLNASELETIEKVGHLFSDMTAGDISKASHLETAWLNHQAEREAISYQEAFDLKYD